MANQYTKKKEAPDWKTVCVALVCLTLLEIYALSQGINGAILSIVIAVIAGIAGWRIPANILNK